MLRISKILSSRFWARAVPLIALSTVLLLPAFVVASEPGLPFTEDFADTDLRDDAQTNANWSMDEQALVLGWRAKRFGAFGTGVSGVDVTADADDTWSVALGDVDGDGDLDLVAGNYFSQPNRLYLNNGTSDPWYGVSGVDVTADADDTWSVVLGDVDGDGDLDLVTGNYNDTNRLYLNNGTADPWNGVVGVDVTADADTTLPIALGDVDGDGDLDLVTGNYIDTNRLYLNNGTADPWNGVVGVDVTTDADATYSVALGDVDGDGDLDLVTGNYNDTNRLYLNNGTADPWNGVVGVDVTADADITYSVALGDVDGDGDLDLVAGNYSDPNRLYLNNGTSDPWNGVSGVDVTTDADATYSVALGDVDGDGDLDLVAGNYNDTNRLYLNNGTSDPWNGVSGVDVSADADDTRSVALGDVDGDGDLDLVAGNSNSERNRLYLNNGTSDPWNGVSGVHVTADTNFTRFVALGDVDGDGDLDLVTGNHNDPNRLYLNNGTSDPWNGVSGVDVTADADITYSVALGDVDGDGDLDLVTGNHNDTNRLYLNNGTSDPWNDVSGVDVTADANDTWSVALCDVDGDGDLDLVAGNYNDTNRLYLNNGTSDPWNGVSGVDVTADTDTTLSVALGDVDGDGDLDLVAGNLGANRLYLNNGTSDPWNGVSGVDVTADTDYTRSVVVGDVDGDGDLDLMAGNSGANRLYLNNDTADPWNGVSGVDVTADADITYSVALGDVDGDGDLDLLAGNSGQNRLYLNNGTADPWNGVAGVDVTSDAAYTRSVALGDVDGDGDLDLLEGNYNDPNRLYRATLYHTGHGRATSLEVDTETSPIGNATLTATATLPANTGENYWLSNDGGQHWFLVRRGRRLIFPTSGSDLRWKAELSSLSPASTPRVEEIQIITEIDSDGDGPPDVVDNCPYDPNPTQEDADTDTLGDACDNCPDDWNPDQTDADADTQGDVCDNCPEVWTEVDADSDGWGDGTGCDCDDDNSATYPGAGEVNDGEDNQCPGDDGYGLIDEIEGVCGFHNGADKDEFSWAAQSGTTSYEVARCAAPQFSSGCTQQTTSAAYWSDGEPVAQGTCHHYLVRALAPYEGSWGGASAGERTGICP